jgi:hypothetical protein
MKSVLSLAGATLLSTALVAVPAFAAQNVANTSQKGSLLIFPKIEIDRNETMIIRISNDKSQAVNVKCYYINETKGRQDFGFKLTAKQPAYWDVRTGFANFEVDIGDDEEIRHSSGVPAAWVTDDQGFGPAPHDDTSRYEGELICFAVDPTFSNQISWNHLSGTATTVEYDDFKASEYNAWAFTARGGVAGQPHGAPGVIKLSGADDGTSYDACPKYNLMHFTPIGTELVLTYNDHAEYEIESEEIEVSVSTCKQDLRQDYLPRITKVKMTVWNENEHRATGAYECTDSTETFEIADVRDYDRKGRGCEVDSTCNNFQFDRLQTGAAVAKLQGIASYHCDIPGYLDTNGDGIGDAPLLTQPTGLVAVVSSQLELEKEKRDYENEKEVDIGVTTRHAGVSLDAANDVVLWDAGDGDEEDPESNL